MEKQQKKAVDRWKYLTFSLGREYHGTGLLKVKEITDLMSVAYLPGFPVCLDGIINLRGKFIPVLDIRPKCSMESVCYTERTCIIFVEMPTTTKGKVSEVGIIVDAVSEVINIRKKEAKQHLPLAKKEPEMPY